MRKKKLPCEQGKSPLVFSPLIAVAPASKEFPLSLKKSYWKTTRTLHIQYCTLLGRVQRQEQGREKRFALRIEGKSPPCFPPSPLLPLQRNFLWAWRDLTGRLEDLCKVHCLHGRPKKEQQEDGGMRFSAVVGNGSVLNSITLRNRPQYIKIRGTVLGPFLNFWNMR